MVIQVESDKGEKGNDIDQRPRCYQDASIRKKKAKTIALCKAGRTILMRICRLRSTASCATVVFYPILSQFIYLLSTTLPVHLHTEYCRQAFAQQKGRVQGVPYLSGKSVVEQLDNPRHNFHNSIWIIISLRSTPREFFSNCSCTSFAAGKYQMCIGKKKRKSYDRNLFVALKQLYKGANEN